MCACPVVSDCGTVDCRARLLCPWDAPGKNMAVGCHPLFQGIFPPGDQNQVSCTGSRTSHCTARECTEARKVNAKCGAPPCLLMAGGRKAASSPDFLLF